MQGNSWGLILDKTPQYIFWKDLNSVYLGCNQRWAEFVGLANEGQVWFESSSVPLLDKDQVRAFFIFLSV